MMPRRFRFSDTSLEKLLREARALPADHPRDHQDIGLPMLWVRAYGPSARSHGEARVVPHIRIGSAVGSAG